MGRKREPLKFRQEKNIFAVRFFHPVRQRTERIALGPSAGIAEKKLAYLNSIFLNQENWPNPPQGDFPDVRKAWLGPSSTIELYPGRATKGQQELGSTADDVALWKFEADRWERAYHSLLSEYNALAKEAEHWKGRKLRTGPAVKLADACKAWLAKYQGRDSDHTKIVGYDLWRFVRAFGSQDDRAKDITVDDLEGREQDIDVWLRSLHTKGRRDGNGKIARPGRPIGAGRRAQIRRVVLRCLEDSGVNIKRKAVAPISRQQVRAGRGAIRWLERKQAETVARALAQPWRDLFLVQVGLGLRPDELVTLKREDFSTGFSELTLSPAEHLTLKQGSRKIQIPQAVRKILKARLAGSAVAFPDPSTGKLWQDVKAYDRAYNAALKAAGAAAGVPFKMDCRVGRRTCGSLLLRAGLSVESVAAILGDDPATVREHYARILSKEVDPTPAVLRVK